MFTTAFGAVDKQLNPSHVLKKFCPIWNVTEVHITYQVIIYLTGIMQQKVWQFAVPVHSGVNILLRKKDIGTNLRDKWEGL